MDNSQLFLATRKYSDVDVDDQHKQIFEHLSHTIPHKFKVVLSLRITSGSLECDLFVGVTSCKTQLRVNGSKMMLSQITLPHTNPQHFKVVSRF